MLRTSIEQLKDGTTIDSDYKHVGSSAAISHRVLGSPGEQALSLSKLFDSEHANSAKVNDYSIINEQMSADLAMLYDAVELVCTFIRAVAFLCTFLVTLNAILNSLQNQTSSLMESRITSKPYGIAKKEYFKTRRERGSHQKVEVVKLTLCDNCTSIKKKMIRHTTVQLQWKTS
jgi:hypothetical protein